MLLNLFSGKKLKHARAMYRKYGVQRSVLLPISSQQLPSNTTEKPWLDTPEGAAKLPSDPRLQKFDAATQEAIKAWSENGYLILRGCFKT